MPKIIISLLMSLLSLPLIADPITVYEMDSLKDCKKLQGIEGKSNNENESIRLLNEAASKIGGNYIYRKTGGPDDVVIAHGGDGFAGDITYKGTAYSCEIDFVYSPVFELKKPPHAVNGLITSTNIGASLAQEGEFGLGLVSIYLNKELKYEYRLSLESYSNPYSSSSRSLSYSNIEELSTALKEGITSFYNNKEYSKKVNLGTTWVDKPYDGEIKTLLENQAIQFVWYSSFGDDVITMNIGDAYNFVSLIDYARNIVLSMSPQIEAFNKVKPK